MSIVGTRIGAYEVTASLGEGGMGQVYRARDTKLGRDVALKILTPAFVNDPDRLARFKREAQVLGSLNHPNIAAIYGLEDQDGRLALVMELVEGEDLSAHMARGPITPSDVLPIARQIALALEAAHEQGIVHRDLKPANIKLKGAWGPTPARSPDDRLERTLSAFDVAGCTVKVLDFGLAKALDPAGTSNAEAMNSPTLTNRATEAGIILGTAAYMSPEQAKGRVVDKRADIWAFGVVLLEMLSGKRAFDGESVAETLGLIFARDAGQLLSSLPAETPAALRTLITRCLVKDPRERLRDIGDGRQLIDDAIAGRGEPALVTAPASALASGRRVSPALAIGATILVAAIAAAAGWFSRPASATPTLRFSIALPPGEQVTTAPAISTDGRLIAYAAGRTPMSSQLYLRAIDDFTARPVASSADAQYPFFSPDGRTIAFFAGGKLRRASVDGGAAIDVASSPTPWGGTYDADGQIVYTTGLNGGLWRVSPDGGQAVQLTKPDSAGNGYAHVYPQRLPGTRDLLFAFWGQTFYSAVLSAESRTWRPVTPPKKALAGVAIWIPGGYVASNDGGGGVGVTPWTPKTTEMVSADSPVIDRVYWGLSTELSWLAVSENGTAVYVPGDAQKRRLVWVDRESRATAIPGDPAFYYQATLSPDGRRIVAGGMAAQWMLDAATGARTRLVSDARTWHGGWLPGKARVVVSSNKGGDWDLFTVSAAGGELTLLLERPFAQHPVAIGADGVIIYLERQPATGSDLWKLAPDGTTTPLAVTRFNETSASISADDRFMAYASDEPGRNEVFVMPMSGKGERKMVSINGGTGPIWSRDGKELFYRAGDDLMSLGISTANGVLTLGERRKLLDLSAYDSGYFHEFDVTADGKQFLLIRSEPSARPTRLDVVTNWVDELRTKTGKR